MLLGNNSFLVPTDMVFTSWNILLSSCSFKSLRRFDRLPVDWTALGLRICNAARPTQLEIGQNVKEQITVLRELGGTEEAGDPERLLGGF